MPPACQPLPPPCGAAALRAARICISLGVGRLIGGVRRSGSPLGGNPGTCRFPTPNGIRILLQIWCRVKLRHRLWNCPCPCRAWVGRRWPVFSAVPGALCPWHSRKNRPTAVPPSPAWAKAIPEAVAQLYAAPNLKEYSNAIMVWFQNPRSIV